MNIELPDLDSMNDIEAVRWYTSEVARLSKEKFHDDSYIVALLDWKRKMNTRIRQNRLRGWDDEN